MYYNAKKMGKKNRRIWQTLNTETESPTEDAEPGKEEE